MAITRCRLAWLIVSGLGLAAGRGAYAQESVTVPLSDPSRPGTLTVAIVQGTITVKGANRKDVLIVSRQRAGRSARWNEPDANGLRRLTPSAGFKVVEANNEVSIATLNPNHGVDFDIQVPTRDGWVFVNPFMTLVASYERLIRGRGTQMAEPVAAVSTDPATTGSAEASTKIMEPEKAKPSKRAESASKKRKAAKQAKQKSKAAKQAKQFIFGGAGALALGLILGVVSSLTSKPAAAEGSASTVNAASPEGAAAPAGEAGGTCKKTKACCEALNGAGFAACAVYDTAAEEACKVNLDTFKKAVATMKPDQAGACE